VLREIETAPPSRIGPLLKVLGDLWCAQGDRRVACVSKDEWVDLVLAHIEADPSNLPLTTLPLAALAGCRQTRSGGAEPAEIPGLLAAWKATLATERAVLHEGLLPIVSGQTDPKLVPASFECTLWTGEVWPSRP
jgi:hypothetical protein